MANHPLVMDHMVVIYYTESVNTTQTQQLVKVTPYHFRNNRNVLLHSNILVNILQLGVSYN